MNYSLHSGHRPPIPYLKLSITRPQPHDLSPNAPIQNQLPDSICLENSDRAIPGTVLQHPSYPSLTPHNITPATARTYGPLVGCEITATYPLALTFSTMSGIISPLSPPISYQSPRRRAAYSSARVIPSLRRHETMLFGDALNPVPCQSRDNYATAFRGITDEEHSKASIASSSIRGLAVGLDGRGEEGACTPES